MIELPYRVPYVPRWRSILLCAAFFGLGGLVIALKALHSAAGMTIFGVVRLGPESAATFRWILVAIAGGFVVLALGLALSRCANLQFIELGTDALWIPQGRFSRKRARLAYSEITGVSEFVFLGQRYLSAIANGRHYSIVASLFPGIAEFETVRDFLMAHVSSSQSRHSGLDS